MKINYYDLYYTIMKNRDEKEEEELVEYDNNYNCLYDIGIKPREKIFR